MKHVTNIRPTDPWWEHDVRVGDAVLRAPLAARRRLESQSWTLDPEAYLREVMAADWFAAAFPHARVDVIRLNNRLQSTGGRSHRPGKSIEFMPGLGAVEVENTALHELGHAVTRHNGNSQRGGSGGHTAAFRRNHLTIVCAVRGRRVAKYLRESYAAHGLIV